MSVTSPVPKDQRRHYSRGWQFVVLFCAFCFPLTLAANDELDDAIEARIEAAIRLYEAKVMLQTIAGNEASRQIGNYYLKKIECLAIHKGINIANPASSKIIANDQDFYPLILQAYSRNASQPASDYVSYELDGDYIWTIRFDEERKIVTRTDKIFLEEVTLYGMMMAPILWSASAQLGADENLRVEPPDRKTVELALQLCEGM